MLTRQFLPGYFHPRLPALSAQVRKLEMSSAFLFKGIYEMAFKKVLRLGYSG
jgi:hypothetical protein